MGRHSVPNDVTREFALPYQPRHAAPTTWDLAEWVGYLKTSEPEESSTTQELPMPGKVLSAREKWTIRLLVAGLILLLLASMVVNSST